MAITRRIRGTRTTIPAGKIIGRLPATGAGSAQVIDPADLGRALIASGVVAPLGSNGATFTLGSTVITVNGATYSTVSNLTLSTPTITGHNVTMQTSASAGAVEASDGITIGSSSAYFGLALSPTGTNANNAWIEMDGFGTAAPFMEGVQARGTPNAPTAVISADNIYGYLGKGYDGTAYVWGAGFGFIVSGTVSTGVVPMSVQIKTMNAGGTFDVRQQVWPSGGYYIGTGGGADPGANNLQVKGAVLLSGATSGAITMQAAAVAGSNTITWPAGTTNFSATGGAGQYVKQSSSGGAFTVGTIPYSDIANPLYVLVVVNPDGTIPHYPDGTLGYVLSALP